MSVLPVGFQVSANGDGVWLIYVTLSSVYHIFRPLPILVVLARNCHMFAHVTNTHNQNPQGLGPTSSHGLYVSYTIAELILTLQLLRFSWHAFLASANLICISKIGGPGTRRPHLPVPSRHCIRSEPPRLGVLYCRITGLPPCP